MVAALGAVLVARLSSPGDAAPAVVVDTSPSQHVAATTHAPTAPRPPSVSPSVPPTPVPTSAPTPAPTAAPTPVVATTYTVRSGDTLYAIADRYGTTVQAIRELNGIEGNLLRIGQLLRIGPPG